MGPSSYLETVNRVPIREEATSVARERRAEHNARWSKRRRRQQPVQGRPFVLDERSVISLTQHGTGNCVGKGTHRSLVSS